MTDKDRKDIMTAIIIAGVESRDYYTNPSTIVKRALLLLKELEKREENKS